MQEKFTIQIHHYTYLSFCAIFIVAYISSMNYNVKTNQQAYFSSIRFVDNDVTHCSLKLKKIAE